MATPNPGPAQAQGVEAARELEHERLGEDHVLYRCDHARCRWVSRLRSPTTRFRAKKEAERHTKRTGHPVEPVELPPDVVAQLRDQFRFDVDVQDAAREAYQRAAVEAEQADQDATPDEIGEAIRDLGPGVSERG